MICGIDPGLDGAIAFVAPDLITVSDMPTLEITVNGKKKRQIDLYALARLMDLHAADVKLAVIEDPHASPGAGVSSMFNFGFSCGVAQMSVASNFIRMHPVRPATWKKAMGLTADKDLSRKLASQMYPHFSHLWNLKKHDGRAEAVLLAKYGERHLQ